MLKLEIDWAGADNGMPVPPSGEGVMVELVAAEGKGSGWPVWRIVATDGPTLWAWLLENYAQDGDDASWWAGEAEEV